jgi:hypothetical protein
MTKFGADLTSDDAILPSLTLPEGLETAHHR